MTIDVLKRFDLNKGFKMKVYKNRLKINMKIILLIFIITFYNCYQFAAKDDRPNIVVIMSDDMGFSDLGCYGGEVNTPNLDRLASNGLRFTQFYNTGRCCPTRGSLLTGLYPHQSGIGHMMSDDGTDGYRGDLSNNALTIAEVLKTEGYKTYMSGKWHVTPHIKPNGPKYNWPLQRGFDHFYGTIHGAGSFYDPNSLTRDNTQISPFYDENYKPLKYYYTDAISDHAVNYVKDHKKEYPESPFFMYVAYTAPHWPMHALEKDIEKYKGGYDKGYEAIRNERIEKMKRLKLLNEDWKIPPSAMNWNEQKYKNWEARNMEVYAAMIDNMDQGIGRLVSELEKTRQFNNTLILYMQDNGGCAEGLGRGAAEISRSNWEESLENKIMMTSKPDLPDMPPMNMEVLQKDMIPKQTRDGYLTRMGPNNLSGPDGTYIAYGKGWANVSNVPFREYKHYVHEGGISTPLIAHWPSKIKDKGQLRHTPGHLIDIMATCVDVARAKYPQVYKNRPILPMEGKSLASVFVDDTLERDWLLWEHEGNRAIRKGDWKLVMKRSIGKWELYNIVKDRTEMLDLSKKNPEIFNQMKELWTKEAIRTKVIPQPNRFLPAKGKKS